MCAAQIGCVNNRIPDRCGWKDSCLSGIFVLRERKDLWTGLDCTACEVCNNDAVLWKGEEKVGFDYKMLWFEGEN